MQVNIAGKIAYQTPDHCFNCVHYMGERKCKAFIEEIPDEIFKHGNLHKTKFKGQIGEFVFKSNIDDIINILKNADTSTRLH